MQEIASHAKIDYWVLDKLLAKCKIKTEDNCSTDIAANLRFGLQALNYAMALSDWFEMQRAVLQD